MGCLRRTGGGRHRARDGGRSRVGGGRRAGAADPRENRIGSEGLSVVQWVSTRGSAPPISFVDALFAGTAPDGGLYMPERLEPLPTATLESLRGADLVTIGSV